MATRVVCRDHERVAALMYKITVAILRGELNVFVVRTELGAILDKRKPGADEFDALLDPTKALGLTPREQEVLQLLVEGLTNKEIALRLFVKEHTVKFHTTNIFKKMEVRNRTETVAKYMQLQMTGGSHSV